MSLNLLCPNCGRVIGEASHEDNYIKHYHYFNKKQEPICLTCGTGKSSTINIIIEVIIVGLIIGCILVI